MAGQRPQEKEREFQNLLGEQLGERDTKRLGSESERVLACLVARLIVAAERR